MDRTSLIKLIHIGKRDLHLDDETYKALLANAAGGKTSCRDMTVPELVRVLSACQKRGFKIRSKPASRGIKPGSLPAKIRATWREMHQQGFIGSSSDAALNAWLKRGTAGENGGLGVEQLAWLNKEPELAVKVLESLKRWHRRCMLEKLPPGTPAESYDKIVSRYRAHCLNIG